MPCGLMAMPVEPGIVMSVGPMEEGAERGSGDLVDMLGELCGRATVSGASLPRHAEVMRRAGGL